MVPGTFFYFSVYMVVWRVNSGPESPFSEKVSDTFYLIRLVPKKGANFSRL
jgi:hypothetical protein